ncbi:uncharacterized protein [Temnothorax longispinosus]
MKAHILNVHGISLDDETVTLPDDLKQYYSELTGYKAKCNNCGTAVSFLTNIENLRVHLRRHSILPTRIQSQNEADMVPRKKRSKLWNYFEELKPSLVKCTTCKKEIKILHPRSLTTLFRAHLKRHKIFLDNDIRTLPDDLKQYYSELPGYKAKCNNCGKAVSFLTKMAFLRRHLRRHSTITQSRDEADMVPRKKRSKLWNYFEELTPSLVKCTTCKKEIKILHPTSLTTLFRAHLKRHKIFLDNDIRTLPDDLKQYYSELPGYKAKCKDCGKTLSFLTDFKTLRIHLRRHSTRIQSRDETVMVPRKKRSKFWNYFEELKPTLVKCTTCKKEIKISRPSHCTPTFRAHLKRHEIFLDNDIRTLPDDLKQYYSELPGYKAKCNNCGKAVSFLTNFSNLRTHFRKHCTRTHSQDETTPTKKRSKFWNYFKELKPTLVKCTTCKKEIKISRPKHCIKIMRIHLSRHGIFLDDDIRTIPDDLRQCYSELPGYKAKCNNCGETVSFLTNFSNLRTHFRRHCTRTHSQDETAQTKKRSKLWNYFEKLKPKLLKCTTCKKEIKISHPKHYVTRMRIHLSRHGIFLDTLPDDLRQCYSELPGYKAKCNNCGETVSFLTNFSNLRRHFRRHCTRIQNQNETVMVPRKKRSKFWNYFEELKPTLVKCTTCKKEIKISHPKHYVTRMRIHLSRHGIFLDTLPDDLRQCYSELPGYKAKCNNCGETVSFLTNFSNLRRHFRRHCTRIRNQNETVIMAPKRKSRKLWNYFKELNPSLAKCTICKKEIKISHSTARTRIFRVHLYRHGIFLDNDTYTLRDDFKQYYSELPRYKAKCKDCDKTLSFLSNMENLRKHLRNRHSTTIQSRDETTPTKKRNKLWNYFEELNPSLAKCTTCKKEIKVSHPTRRITIFRAHLKRHGIYLDDDIRTLPDDLRQYYSELPGYKAKCNNCGQTYSFLRNSTYLRKHLRRHFTIIQSRDETTPTKKRNKLWNYFEELNPSLVKCTTCKKEIKVSHPTNCTRIFRVHLLNVHGIYLDDDIRTLPDDLRQYYSELPGYKAKCNNCGQTYSFLKNSTYLRKHLRRHFTIIQSRDETTPTKKQSKLWNYFEELKPTLVKCTTCKKEIKVSDPTKYTRVMRMHLSRHGIFLDNDTHTLPDDLRQYYSELRGYKAKCNNCGETVSFSHNIVNLRKHLRRHSTRIQSRDEPSTSSLADDNVGPSARCQGQDDTSGLLVQSFIKERTEKTGALNEPGTLISTDYNTNPTAECESQETVDLDPQTCEQSRKDTRACDGPSTSNLADNSIDPSAGRQSQDTSDLPIQSLKEAIEKTGALDKPSTLSSTAYIIMDLSTEEYIPLRQSQEQVPSGLPVQSFKETAENTGVLDEPSTSVDCVMDPSAEHQSEEQPGLPVQSFEQMTGETSALHSCIDVIIQFNKYPTS